ncbi:hypothetical protein KQX54_004855 [Cotesia glomerata]|uniref:Uncharacterized protein n=1 Tax=Cotesia glomerata TaxID=32391 RepID=A0AAV7IMP5_COTGL|nr:hypothetical protein KQX54_004855 [Cotesia glomerata]
MSKLFVLIVLIVFLANTIYCFDIASFFMSDNEEKEDYSNQCLTVEDSDQCGSTDDCCEDLTCHAFGEWKMCIKE